MRHNERKTIMIHLVLIEGTTDIMDFFSKRSLLKKEEKKIFTLRLHMLLAYEVISRPWDHKRIICMYDWKAIRENTKTKDFKYLFIYLFFKKPPAQPHFLACPFHVFSR